MNHEKFYVVIPARYASSRLPGKLLLDIAGKPMLQHVYENALKSVAQKVVIAVDDERLSMAAQKFGATVCMTAKEHSCGTDRIAEAVKVMGWKEEDVIVNVQGDEPLIDPAIINQVAQNLILNKSVDMATLSESLTCAQDLFDPNIVKLVTDKAGYVLYFSRAPIPWDREHFKQVDIQAALPLSNIYCRHVGIYAYRVGFLTHYVELRSSPLEKIEMLEQLRALWHGYKIHAQNACVTGMMGIDTEEDLAKVRALLEKA